MKVKKHLTLRGSLYVEKIAFYLLSMNTMLYNLDSSYVKLSYRDRLGELMGVTKIIQLLI